MILAELVREGFQKLGPDNEVVLLADAALHYNSTSAHNARAQGRATEMLVEELMLHEQTDPETAALAADAGESVEEFVCGTRRGHAFNSPDSERDRCYCVYCGKDGDA